MDTSNSTSSTSSTAETVRACADAYALACAAYDARVTDREFYTRELITLSDAQLLARLSLHGELSAHETGVTSDKLVERLLDSTMPLSAKRLARTNAEHALTHALKAHGTPRPDYARDDAHTLMPDWLVAQTPTLYATEDVRYPFVWAKFFTPWSSWTWYVTEYSARDGRRLCFGLVDGLERELGYFSLDELERLTGPMGLRIERDMYWTPKRLSVVRASESAL